MKFYSNQNNGIVAVIREDHARTHETIVKSGGDPSKAVKVFTFYSNQDLAKSYPAHYAIYTGDLDDLKWLIEKGGHELLDECGPWSGFVPFSNGFDIAKDSEAGYVTTLSDVRQIFLANGGTQRALLNKLSRA